MLTAIQGTYENGQVTLKETPKTDHKMNVIVTFLEEDIINPLPKKKRQAGVLSGKVWMADDFNAPLDDLKDYM
jgi:Protein of unknown function (DUF2281)